MLLSQHRNRRGAVLIMVMALMVVLIGMVVFAFEVSRMYLVRAQAQTAVDAGALAAALTLKADDTDISEATSAANNFVQLNRVGWLVTVPTGLIQVDTGVWDPDSQAFTSTTESPNSVRVSARQENEPFMFARLFGRSRFGISRQAIAAAVDTPMDIMMVLDLSGSMASDGRIEALQNAAPSFVDIIEANQTDDQIGVMGYGVEPDDFDPEDHGSGTPYTSAPLLLYPDPEDSESEWVAVLECDLTDNFNDIRDNELDTSSLIAQKYGGGTPIGAAIRDGAHYLVANGRIGTKKVIVFMSDGHANKPSSDPDQYAIDMAVYAESQDISVYTISLGDSADVALMEAIAAAASGQHFDATGSGEAQLTQNLTNAFERTALAIKRTSLVQ